jgi:YD repeat-containing protein
VHNADGTTTSQAPNSLGQTTSQSGAGVIAAGFGYDKQGRLTSLTTHRSGGTGGAGATTGWQYDPATGQLQRKTYSDGSHTDYAYNAAGQLKSVVAPGMSETLGYNAAGQQTSYTAIDSLTGQVSSSTQVDDQGRPSITTATDNGKTFSNVTTYTALGQLQNETFGSAGGATVSHGYYPLVPAANDPTAPTQSPNALASVTIQNLPNGQANAATTYGYDPITKRLKTITINGVTFTIAYLANSNQIASITAGTVTTTFTPDAADAARLGVITANGPGGSILYRSDLGYNQLDQINSQTVLQENGTNDGSSYNNYTYVYDPNQANALTQVKDSAGNVLYSYSYDGVGNQTGTALGTANDLNQYSALSYNARGDVTDDGTYAYTYDANDRMISVTPHDTTQPKLTYGYDAQGRRLWKDVYNFDTETDEWNLAYSRHYVYDGSNLVGELDGNNTLLTGYTWGANGQLLAVTDYTQATPKTYVAVIDPSGNTALLIDPIAGTVAASYTYDPYGNLLTGTGLAQGICSILGKGQYFDAEARSLWHAGLRDGRNNIWYERDKAGEIAGGLNLYEPYGNDPIDTSDRSGLAPTQTAKDLITGLLTVGLSENVFRMWPASRQPVGNVVVGAVSNIVLNGADTLRPFKLMRQDGVGLYAAGLSKSDAVTVSVLRQIPITQSVIAGTELYNNTSLYGADFGSPLDATGKLSRGVVIGGDVILVVGSVGTIGASPASVEPPIVTVSPRSPGSGVTISAGGGGFFEINLPAAASRYRGMVINPFARGSVTIGAVEGASATPSAPVTLRGLNFSRDLIQGQGTYVLKDAETGQVLKVGSARDFDLRFQEYRSIEAATGRSLSVDLYKHQLNGSFQLETNLRQAYEASEGPLFWDGTGSRAGSMGFASGEFNLRNMVKLYPDFGRNGWTMPISH